MKHRPIGLGVQGLADVFVMMNMPFGSDASRKLNRNIFETMYYASLDASCALAERDGPYESYEGSPASQCKLQFDLWDVEVDQSRHDWRALRERIFLHGLRNSLLIAPMPTASTAQILGNNECFEPFTSNIYARRVLAGEFAVVNKHLVERLQAKGLWTEDIRQQIIAANGSVQSIREIPDTIKALFRTAWEISMRDVIDLAADRGPFVDQSQSLNLFMANPTHAKLTSMHFYAWKKGLKTGMYYLRTKPATDAVKVTVPVATMENMGQKNDDAGGCLMCSA